MSLRLLLGHGIGRAFTFTWVNHLRIAIEQRDNGPSQPFSWSGDATRNSDGRLLVHIDFAGQGDIWFQCESISIGGVTKV